ncbi:MAG: hypothetical protein DM484_27620 [Candidatus Methylumidiphilus alinenensis]|uniref:HAD family hydrolase n=1 Tax=Candidatus Methylumidiphilus alinenensis TaxID=2202197 RepID=A0A2W4QST6_9GAMM|nr:MAG: hypothetical protein DM484_27620 [Candidatus Methylumidiphilus alinenensis]
MKIYDVISLDAYGTIFNVNAGVAIAEKNLLPELDGRGNELWDVTHKELNILFDEMQRGVFGPFCNAKELYRRVFLRSKTIRSFNIDISKYVEFICYSHSHSPAYDGAIWLVKELHKIYNYVVLTSDADNDFLLQAVSVNAINFDYVFTSEDAHEYKAQSRSNLFMQVIKTCSVSPDRIIHIGDSQYDLQAHSDFGIDVLRIRHNADNSKGFVTTNQSAYEIKEIAEILGC